jgi:hypothetical protein
MNIHRFICYKESSYGHIVPRPEKQKLNKLERRKCFEKENSSVKSPAIYGNEVSLRRSKAPTIPSFPEPLKFRPYPHILCL